jgi:hypothetical protein
MVGNNILYNTARAGAPPRVAAILGRHWAGWFPAYRELCKMMWTGDPAGDDEIELVMKSTGIWQYTVSRPVRRVVHTGAQNPLVLQLDAFP